MTFCPLAQRVGTGSDVTSTLLVERGRYRYQLRVYLAVLTGLAVIALAADSTPAKVAMTMGVLIALAAIRAAIAMAATETLLDVISVHALVRPPDTSAALLIDAMAAMDDGLDLRDARVLEALAGYNRVKDSPVEHLN